MHTNTHKYVYTHKLKIKREPGDGVLAHTFNHNIWEAEADKFL